MRKGVAGVRPQQRDAPATHTAMPATAKPSRSRSHSEKPRCFRLTSRWVCRIYDTTAPTKEGLLWDDKIVSNLHEQMSRGFGSGLKISQTLGINCTRQYGARHFAAAASLLIVSVRRCHSR